MDGVVPELISQGVLISLYLLCQFPPVWAQSHSVCFMSLFFGGEENFTHKGDNVVTCGCKAFSIELYGFLCPFLRCKTVYVLCSWRSGGKYLP